MWAYYARWGGLFLPPPPLYSVSAVHIALVSNRLCWSQDFPLYKSALTGTSWKKSILHDWLSWTISQVNRESCKPLHILRNLFTSFVLFAGIFVDPWGIMMSRRRRRLAQRTPYRCNVKNKSATKSPPQMIPSLERWLLTHSPFLPWLSKLILAFVH